MNRSQIAINAVSTRHANLEEALDAYAGAGFKQVEFVIPQLKGWLTTHHKKPGDLKAMLDQRSLKCIGGFETGVVCFGDAAAKSKNQQIHIDNACLLAALGGGTIVVGTDGPEKNSVEALQVIGRTMAELADKIDASVRLAVEFNWSPIMKSIRSALAVVEAANHQRVGILFDPAHFHCTTSKFEDITPRMVKHVFHVHVDDMNDKPGELSDCNADRVLPGQGTLDLPRILGRLEELGYRGQYSIEMFNEQLWSMPAAQAAKLMYQAMEKLCR